MLILLRPQALVVNADYQKQGASKKALTVTINGTSIDRARRGIGGRKLFFARYHNLTLLLQEIHMNKARRKVIAEMVEELSVLRARIEQLQEEEQDALDNLPDGIQASDRGQIMQAAADALGNACDELDNVTAALVEASGDEA